MFGNPFLKKGFVIRDGSSIIAWNKNGEDSSINIASHCDSPCLILKKVSSNPEAVLQNRVQIYPSPLLSTWISRDLRLSGRIFYREKQRIREVLFDSKEAVAYIPPPPYNFNSNISTSFNRDTSLNPIFGQKGSIIDYICNKLQIKSSQIFQKRLFLHDAQPPLIVNGLLRSKKLDDCIHCYCSLKSFLEVDAPPTGQTNLITFFDHEEMGSRTKVGAKGDLIDAVLNRIILKENFLRFKMNSLIISSDVNHADHPNWPEKANSILPVPLGHELGYLKMRSLWLLVIADQKFLF